MISPNEIAHFLDFFNSIQDDGSKMGYVRFFKRKVNGVEEWVFDAQRIVPGEDSKMEGVTAVKSISNWRTEAQERHDAFMKNKADKKAKADLHAKIKEEGIGPVQEESFDFSDFL